LSLDQEELLHPRLSLTPDGVCEFTFSALYLSRDWFKYRISRGGPNGGFILSGEKTDKFFMTPCEAPARDILESLFATHDSWKIIPPAVFESSRPDLEAWGITVNEDRDNFDYLYQRGELAELKGKKYHKKKNLVNQFTQAYSHELKPLTKELVPHALEVLDQWRQDKAEDFDYLPAKEALEKFDLLKMRGCLFYADGKPAGYCLGESIAKGRIFAIHFEKGIDRYKGIYQYMNQAFAAYLPNFFTYINREQDLGDLGLRQAKMTYRPAGFVKKYIGRILTTEGCCPTDSLEDTEGREKNE